MKDINTSESYKLVELETRIQADQIEELEARLEMFSSNCSIGW